MRFANQLDSLQKEIDRSNETFTEHYKGNYTNPAESPCCMSLEVSSMGLLSKIFQNLRKCKEKNAIAFHFGISDVAILENWMLCFSTLRNISAHHGRVWNKRIVPIKLPYYTRFIFLKNKDIYTNKLYATLSCIENILKIISPESTFSSRLKGMMITCPLAQEKEMGFPKGWQDESLWQ